jgi:membrane-associated phospholipid phosphatase
LLYGDNAPLSIRNDADAGLSFLSSHASVSFAVATSTFMTVKRLHPKSAMPYVVLAIGDVTAGFVATARVMAGKHFITDAVGGAIIGTSVGVLVPALHTSPVKIVPVVSERERGLELLGVF